MAVIPPDQKFHTLDPLTPTAERGSALANAGREIYTMQDIIDTVAGGGEIDFIELGDTPNSYPLGSAGQAVIVNGAEDGLIFGPAGGNITLEAVLITNITAGISRLQYYFDEIDATTGLPRVTGGNTGPTVQGEYSVGIAISGSAGDVVDLAVHGTFDNVRFSVGVGDTPDVSTTLYIGSGSQIYEGQLTTVSSDDNFSAGRIVSTPTLVASYPGFYDVYEATVFINMPWLNSYYRDGVLYYDSTRIFRKTETGTVENGEIVKLNSSDNAERWDVSAGDTVNQIAGVTTTDTLSSDDFSAVCLRGLITLPLTDVIGGASAVVGDILYSDATNSYELTTDPTSGIQIGIVIDLLGFPVDKLLIDINPIKGGGGATTGEKLDFTVRSSAYTGATGEHEGIDLKLGGAASVTAGLAYYWDGDWNASDAVLPASGDGLMAMATDTGVGVNMMQKGIIQLAANPTGAVAGSVLYFESGTPGTLTATAPSASGNIVRVAGHAIDAAGLVYFDPSEDWLEIV